MFVLWRQATIIDIMLECYCKKKDYSTWDIQYPMWDNFLTVLGYISSKFKIAVRKKGQTDRVRQRFALQFFRIFLFLLTITSRKCSLYPIKAMRKLCASGLKLYNGTLSLSIKSKLVILSSHFGSYEKLRHLKSCTILALSKYGGNVLYFI